MASTTHNLRMPQLIVFDLDYTLWPMYIDTHVVSPLRRDGDTLNAVTDKYNETISFYPEVPQVLHQIRDAGIPMAVASRTGATKLARSALDLLLIPPPAGLPEASPLRAVQFFKQMEIYPGSKIVHFKKLHENLKIPYSEMLFFDDESRNKEVQKKLGVTFFLINDGTNQADFEKGLAKWRERTAQASEANP